MTRDQVRAAVQEWLKGEPDMAVMPQFSPDNKQMWEWAAEAVHEAGPVRIRSHRSGARIRQGRTRRGRAHLGIRAGADDAAGAGELSEGRVSALGVVPEGRAAHGADDSRRRAARCLSQSDDGLRAWLAERAGAQARRPDVRPLPKRRVDGVLPGESCRRIAAQVQGHQELLRPARKPCSAGEALA